MTSAFELLMLAGLVVGGVSLVVLVTHFSGGTARVALADDDAVRAAWIEDQGVDDIDAIQLADDGWASLVHLTDGTHGVLVGHGDGIVVRRLGTATVRQIDEQEDHLLLGIADFGAPLIRVRLADDRIRRTWRQRLEA